MAVINAFRQGLFDSQNKALAEAAPGAVARHGEENMKGLSGSLLKLTSAWKLLGAQIFTTGGAADNLSAIFNRAASAINAVAGTNPAVLTMLGDLGIAVASFGALAIAADVLKIAVKGLRLAFAALSLPLTAVGAAIAAVGAAVYAVYAKWDHFKRGFRSGLGPEASAALKKIGNGFNAVAEAAGWLVNQIAPLAGSILGDIVRGFGFFMGSSVRSVIEGVRAIGKAFRYAADAISAAYGAAKSFAGALTGMGTPEVGGVQRGLPKGFSAPGKAAGGAVTGGRPYVVGEVGPELFVPRSSGSIVPNHKLGGGGSVVIHAPISISSSANIEDLKRTLERHLERWANEAFRSVQADTGLRWS